MLKRVIFKNLTNFTYVRSPEEAIGFYLAYLLLYLIMGGIGGTISGLLFGADFYSALRIGAFLALIETLILCYFLLSSKKLYRSYADILIAIISLGFTAYGGGILGLIPLAYLTTRKKIK